jgi:site-specific DNA-methyltransferase (adenine-specific)
MDKLIEQGVKVDAIITDPPYGTTACKWDSVIPFDEMWKRLKLIRKDSSAIVLFGGEPFSSALRISNIKEFKYDWVYRKSQATNFLNSKKQPLRNHEIISVFYKKQCTYNPQMTKGLPYTLTSGKQSKSISNDENITNGGYTTINNGERYPLSITKKYNSQTGLHPTQKPIDLLEYLIRTYTNEGDLVLDFTMGSGSTGIACKNLNRNFIGIELDENYFNITKNRLEV